MAPAFSAARYQSGDEIRAGDRVLWAGSPGRVLIVLGSPEPPEEWSGFAAWLRETYVSGFLVDTEAAGLVFGDEGDEDLILVGR